MGEGPGVCASVEGLVSVVSHWVGGVSGHVIEGFGGGTCNLQGPMDGVGVLEQPTCSKFACWLAKKTEC